MVLALSYMKKTGTDRPEVRKHALEKIDVGYKRLLGFEVPSEPGGFDWWGKAPANLFLTAYGLMEFHNMAEVYPVSERLLGRITAFLRSKQQPDGSWSPEGVRTGWSTDMAKGRAFYLTAYVAWGLARAGQPDEKALAWLDAHADEANDPYGLALAALAFLTADPGSAAGRRRVGRLLELRARDAEGVLWVPEVPTGVGARGDSAAVETTALAVQTLLLDGRHDALVRRALDRLIAWRGGDGRFGTTQSTILALEALVAAASHGPPKGAHRVRVAAGEGQAWTLDLEEGSTEPGRVAFERAGGPTVDVSLVGEGSMRASVARTSWVPWSTMPARAGRVALDVRYPEETLRVGTLARACVTVSNPTDKPASVVTVQVGIPPGCTVRPEDVEGEGAENVERGERAVVIYLRDLAPGERRPFVVPFTPRYAFDVVTAPSTAYEYYVPEEAVVVPPQAVKAVR